MSFFSTNEYKEIENNFILSEDDIVECFIDFQDNKKVLSCGKTIVDENFNFINFFKKDSDYYEAFVLRIEAMRFSTPVIVKRYKEYVKTIKEINDDNISIEQSCNRCKRVNNIIDYNIELNTIGVNTYYQIIFKIRKIDNFFDIYNKYLLNNQINSMINNQINQINSKYNKDGINNPPIDYMITTEHDEDQSNQGEQVLYGYVDEDEIIHIANGYINDYGKEILIYDDVEYRRSVTTYFDYLDNE